jgi:hypothetical protein
MSSSRRLEQSALQIFPAMGYSYYLQMQRVYPSPLSSFADSPVLFAQAGESVLKARDG